MFRTDLFLQFQIIFGTYAGLYQGRFSWNGANIDPDFDYVFLPRRQQFNSMIELIFQNVYKIEGLRARIMMALDRGYL